MPSIKEQLTILYLTIAEFFEQHPAMANWRSSNNSEPEFTDAEVLTISMMQSYFRTPGLKRAFLLVLANDRGAFPKVCTYKQSIARLNRLSSQVGMMFSELAQANVVDEEFYFIDRAK